MKLMAAAGAVMAATTLPASAVIAVFDFYKLKSPTGVGDFLPDGTAGTDYFVVSGDNVSSDFPTLAGGALNFTNNGISLAATGVYFDGQERVRGSVVQDHENGWDSDTGAGLGVYKPRPQGGVDTSDDNITVGETLVITFDQEVTVKNIGLRAEGHDINWDFSPASFLLNGVVTALPEGIGSIDVDMTGTVFTFAYGGNDRVRPDQFYLSSLTACTKDRVPDGGATLALFGLGLASLGALRKRLAK
jgi:hypothetical protein